METSIIPVNTEGKPNDLEHAVSFPTRERAVACFKLACGHLLRPDEWHRLCGALSADFALVGPDGVVLQRRAKLNDYLRIGIPGPGTRAGEGYDWVKVEAMEDSLDAATDEECFGMRVRPCADPQKEDNDTAHFFKRESTSTFIICRKGNTVTVSYHGRNETPNTNTAKVVDNIRNSIIAAGAMVGLSEAQWSALIKAFLEKE